MPKLITKIRNWQIKRRLTIFSMNYFYLFIPWSLTVSRGIPAIPHVRERVVAVTRHVGCTGLPIRVVNIPIPPRLPTPIATILVLVTGFSGFSTKQAMNGLAYRGHALSGIMQGSTPLKPIAIRFLCKIFNWPCSINPMRITAFPRTNRPPGGCYVFCSGVSNKRHTDRGTLNNMTIGVKTLAPFLFILE